uniref:Uncharacterized protein n=1 Tax=Geospiza parvula TaxID=87175 RepID=A0A8C3MY73_GEOPR
MAECIIHGTIGYLWQCGLSAGVWVIHGSVGYPWECVLSMGLCVIYICRRSLAKSLFIFPQGTAGLCQISATPEPRGDTKHQQSFSVGSTVTFVCVPGYTKLPSLSNTIRCLSNSRWSSPPEFCGRSCPTPRPVPFAALSPEDKMQNFYAVNTTVRYICRQGYENTTAQPPTSTCLDNLTWTEVPELCQTISCPPPPAIPHGQHSGNSSEGFVLGSVTTYTCEPGLELVGPDTLRCTGDSGDSGDKVTCPRAPSIANGLHSGLSSGSFPRGVTVSYSCREGFQLLGNESITCTDSGRWSRPLPRCEGLWGPLCWGGGQEGCWVDLTPPCTSLCLPSPRSPFSH